MILANILLQVQNAALAATADTTMQNMEAEAETVTSKSLWELAQAGGPYIMIPLLILSIIAVYIFIERMIVINRASKDELCALKGVGPKLAEPIIALREHQGPFLTPADLEKVPGIGKKKAEGILQGVIFD